MNTTPHTSRLLGLLAMLCLLINSSCVSWHLYEKQVRIAETAQQHAAEANRYAAQAAQCADENAQLILNNQLLKTELTSTRLQYGQLEEANANLLHRYDRYIYQTNVEVEANESERLRLSNAAYRREQALVEANAQHAAQLEQVKAQQSSHTSTSHPQQAPSEYRTPVHSTQQASLAQSAAAGGATSAAPTAATSAASSAATSAAPTAATSAASSAASSEMANALKSHLTGYLPSELEIAADGAEVDVTLAQAFLFPGQSKSISMMGMSALRQLARVVQAVPTNLVRIEIPLPAPDSGEGACDFCIDRVVEALVAAGIERQAIYLPAQQQNRYDSASGPAVLIRSGRLIITVVPTGGGAGRGLSGLPVRY